MDVSKWMTKSMITIKPKDTLRHARELLAKYRINQIPMVINDKLVGIVSIGDVIKHRLEDLELETNVLRVAYIAVH